MMVAPMFVPHLGPDIEAPTPNHFWPMQEGTGTTFSSVVGSALTMTMVGCTWLASGRNGTNCVNIADNQRAYIADPFYYDAMSIAFWFYPTTIDTLKVVLSKRNLIDGTSSSSNEFDILLNSDNTVRFMKWDSGAATTLSLSTTGTFTQNAWNHAVFSTFGVGTTGFAYLNGTAGGSASQTNAMLNSGTAFIIGGTTANNAGRYLNGRIQEVRIYDRGLTDDESFAIYNAITP